MPQATLIMIAALAFAGVAISTGWREAYPDAFCPPPEYAIRYLPQPEPGPIYPAPKLLTVDEIGPPKAEPVVAEDDAPSASPSRPLPSSFHRRVHHSRHHRRRR